MKWKPQPGMEFGKAAHNCVHSQWVLGALCDGWLGDGSGQLDVIDLSSLS